MSRPYLSSVLWGAGLVVGAGVAGYFLIVHDSLTEAAPRAPARNLPSAADDLSSTEGPINLTVRLNKAERLALGLRYAAARVNDRPEKLHLSATTALDPDSLTHVHARFAGKAIEVKVRLGQHVERGQVLAISWSKDLGEKKSEYLDAQSLFQLNKEVLDALKISYRTGAIPERTYRQAIRDQEASRIARDRAHRTLLSWGLTRPEIDGIAGENAAAWAQEEIRAPAAGTVVEKNVVPGELVDPAQNLFVLSDLSHLGIWAYAHEEDLPRLRPGQEWTVHLKALPGKTLTGTIRVVGAVVDPTQHTATVQGTIPNPDGALRAGMFATVTVPFPPRRDLVIVPTSALVDENDRTFVYVVSPPHPDEFQRREVQVKERLTVIALLAGGLQPGEKVVSRGALEIDQKARNGVDRYAASGEEGVMVYHIINWSLHNRLVVILLAVSLAVVGGFSITFINVEAYPDPTPPIVGVIAQNPALSATEMERQITVPLETVMAAIPHRQYLRSISMPGLTSLTIQFRYGADYATARQEVLNRFALANLPAGVTPIINADTPGGEMFYRFVLRGPGYNLNDLKAAADWVLDRQYKQVDGIAELSTFGGTVKQYRVTVAPEALKRYGLTLAQVQNAIAGGNANAGGNFIQLGAEQFDIRGVGLLGGGTDPTTDLPRQRPEAIQTIRQREQAKLRDIRNCVIQSVGGVPLTVGQVGEVSIGHQPRLGQVGINADDDVVQGIVFKYRGVQSRPVLRALQEKTEQINQSGVLPPGMKVETYYDQTRFIDVTTETVVHNLALGMGLVALVLLVFLGNVRSAVIVALSVPLALLFALSLLYARGLSANLLSIGAVDFGIIVDSSVIIVENIYRHLTAGDNAGRPLLTRIRLAAREVQRPLFFSTLIIVLAFIPLFAMQGPEGQIFGPMAETYAFAICGGLLLALTLAPVLCSLWLGRTRPHQDNFLVRGMKRQYRSMLRRVLDHRGLFLLAVGLALGLTVLVLPRIGAEFMPELDEGNLWLRAIFPQQTSLDDADRYVRRIRATIGRVPEVTTVLSQLGRPDDGTDPTPTNNCEFFIDLKPPQERGPGRDRPAIITDIQQRLAGFSGIDFGFSQPIRDNVFEILTGVKGEDSVKLFGTDLRTMEKKADEVAEVLRTVRGLTDVGVFHVLGKPELTIRVDRGRCKRYGVQVADVQAVVQGAIGVKAFTQVVEGEKSFDLIMRLPASARADPRAIGNIPVDLANSQPANSTGAGPSATGTAALLPSATGTAVTATGNTLGGLGRIPLKELADIDIKSGPALVYREHHARFIPIKFSVRGRDLAGAVVEAQRRVAERVGPSLPAGYTLAWGGEYEQMREANARLAVIIPVSLLLILVVLYSAFHSVGDALLVLTNVLALALGGIWALYLTGTPFSVSAAVGFISIFGVAVQDGILLVSYFNQLRTEGLPLREAILRGSELRLRPVLMTSLTAALGLLPAALSTRLGAQPQRPLAIVVVGGMLATVFLTRYLVPVLYSFYSERAAAPEAHA